MDDRKRSRFFFDLQTSHTSLTEEIRSECSLFVERDASKCFPEQLHASCFSELYVIGNEAQKMRWIEEETILEWPIQNDTIPEGFYESISFTTFLIPCFKVPTHHTLLVRHWVGETGKTGQNSPCTTATGPGGDLRRRAPIPGQPFALTFA